MTHKHFATTTRGLDRNALTIRLTSLLQEGEEAVTLDLLPLIMAVAGEGRLEEELYRVTHSVIELDEND